METKTIVNVEDLKNALPHGSGIDYDWTFTEHKNGNISAKNYFHAMNDTGMYDGIMPFKIRIFKHTKTILNKLKGPCEGKTQIIQKKGDIDFSITCNDSARASFYGLKDYLEETISYCLSEAKLINDTGGAIL